MDHVVDVFEGGTDRPAMIAQERMPLDSKASAQLLRDRARAVILARFPDWEQSNMAARGVELQDIARRRGQWTSEQQDEAAALQSAWDWIAAVRKRSNELQAADEQGQQIDLHSGTIAGRGSWPAY